MTKTLAVIPARYASTRFPGKVLAMLGGKPIIQHVWERAVQSKADEVLIAVDEQKVFDAVCAFGGKAVHFVYEPAGRKRNVPVSYIQSLFVVYQM